MAVVDGLGGPLLMVHVDHLNRPVKMTNAAKASVWDAVWLPWGGAHSITGTATMNARFPGQWFQLEAGLHYNWHRSYDPTIGRYTQPDPLGFVDGPSVYGYVRGTPLAAVDLDGRQTVPPRWSTGPYRTTQPLQTGNWSQFQRNPNGTISNRPVISYPVPGAPNFVVTANGVCIPVPGGSSGPVPTRGPGFQYLHPNGQTSVRIMDPVTSGPYQYPTGYVVYHNPQGQTLAGPNTNRTGSRSGNGAPNYHIPIK